MPSDDSQNTVCTGQQQGRTQDGNKQAVYDERQTRPAGGFTRERGTPVKYCPEHQEMFTHPPLFNFFFDFSEIQIYYHGDPIDIKVKINNGTSKVVKKIKVTGELTVRKHF